MTASGWCGNTPERRHSAACPAAASILPSLLSQLSQICRVPALFRHVLSACARSATPPVRSPRDRSNRGTPVHLRPATSSKSTASGALRCLLRLARLDACSGRTAPKEKPAQRSLTVRVCSRCSFVTCHCAGQLPQRPAGAARSPGWACGRRYRTALRRAAPPPIGPQCYAIVDYAQYYAIGSPD
jgi:hypothetical protein